MSKASFSLQIARLTDEVIEGEAAIHKERLRRACLAHFDDIVEHHDEPWESLDIAQRPLDRRPFIPTRLAIAA